MGEKLPPGTVPEAEGKQIRWVGVAVVVIALCSGLYVAGLRLDPLLGDLPLQATGAEDPPRAASWYRNSLRTVIRLEMRQAGPGDSLISRPAGSGFLVSYEGTLFLVTARHVVETAAELWSRIAYRRGVGGELQVSGLRVPRRSWVLHPSERQRVYLPDGTRQVVEPVDVAVARLPWPEGVPLEPLRYCPSSCRAGGHQFAATDPVPPTAVLMIGYPGDLGFEMREPLPLVRFGVVAMAGTEPALEYLGSTSYANARALALDLRSFAGNSGSPVFRAAAFEQGPVLLGLISAGDAKLDYAIAEPVSRIAEALEWAAESTVPNGATWVLTADSGPTTEP